MDITIDNLVKTFGSKTAVNISHLTIRQGELVGLVGNNGAGKTTLFRLALDLLKADEGTLRIGNISVAESEDWKASVAAFIDAGFLIDFLTAEEYFAFIGKIYGLDQKRVDQKMEYFARFMGNEILAQKKYIRNFSAGNRQKIGIVGAMMVEAPIVILDEPFNFLDPTSQLVIKDLIDKYCREMNATVWVSSHNLNHIADVCHRVVVLRDGEILEDMDNSEKNVETRLNHYFSLV